MTSAIDKGLSNMSLSRLNIEADKSIKKCRTYKKSFVVCLTIGIACSVFGLVAAVSGSILICTGFFLGATISYALMTILATVWDKETCKAKSICRKIELIKQNQLRRY